MRPYYVGDIIWTIMGHRDNFLCSFLARFFRDRELFGYKCESILEDRYFESIGRLVCFILGVSPCFSPWIQSGSLHLYSFGLVEGLPLITLWTSRLFLHEGRSYLNPTLGALLLLASSKYNDFCGAYSLVHLGTGSLLGGHSGCRRRQLTLGLA